jgi:hypothetical protein
MGRTFIGMLHQRLAQRLENQVYALGAEVAPIGQEVNHMLR